MSQLFCRICLYKKNEYFTISQDFRNKILKHLSLQMNGNVLICKLCTERIESFNEFYQEIHKNQQNFEEQKATEQAIAQQKDEIRYVIFLKDNKTEIELKEVEDSDPSDIDQQLALLNIPIEEQHPIGDPSSNIVSISAEEQNQNHLQSKVKNEYQPTQFTPFNIEGFPEKLITDGKLNVRGKELSKLISKFYKLECDLCSTKKKFRKFSSMLNHYKTEHLIKGFVTCCGLKICKIRQIAMHMARHIQPEAFQCPLCKKLLTCPKILQYHIQNHLPENERMLVCPEPGCTRRFSYLSALSAHSISHLPEDERTTFCCETCGRKFSTGGRLSSHINTVHSMKILKKEFTCEICSKSFLCKSNLSYHLTTHKNFEFQVECTVCKKWLKNKICLKKHMTIHSEIKHFCEKCDYSAANKQCLMNHKKVQHTDLKPFSCEVCLKEFKLKNTLTNHVNSHHKGLRKYACEFCSKTFVSSGNYYSHRKRMHPQQLSMKLKEKEISEKKQRIEAQMRKGT